MTVLLPVLVPFIGALATFGARAHRWVVPLGVTGAGASAAAAGWTVWQVHEHGPLTVALGDWSPPLGIELRADGVNAVLLVTTALVGLVVSVFAVRWFPGPERPGWSAAGSFWALWLLAWGGLQATFVTTDLFNAFVTLELVTMASVALVALTGDVRQVRAALRYFIAGLVASASYLAGLALLYGAYGTLAMPLLAGRVEGGVLSWMALALTSAGLALKTALFPLHFWLPEAHGSAPAPVSAVLSGLVIKAGFVVLARLWLEVFPGAITPVVAQTVGVLGLVAMAWGGWRALRERRMKMVVAQSTVSQVGLLMLVVPVGLAGGTGSGARAALGVAALLVLAHGMAKASLFLVAGALHQRAGGDELSDLSGAARHVPVLVIAFVLAAVSLIGLPFTAGYAAKSALADLAAAAGHRWWERAIDLTGVVTAAYLLRLGRALVTGGGPSAQRESVSPLLQAAPLVLAGLAVALGLRPGWLTSLVEVGATP
jgi:multicomponent Na+:H+ antiporter subunit D